MSMIRIVQTAAIATVLYQSTAVTLSTRASCHIPAGMVRSTIGKGIPMVVYDGNDIVSNFIRSHHHWEIATTEDFVKPAHNQLPKHGVFLDIGANLGYYSLLFASQGYKVVAVEPMTKNREAFNASLCLNPELSELITVLPAALVAKVDEEEERCIVRSSVHRPNAGNGIMTCGSTADVQPCGQHEEHCDEPFVLTLDSALHRLHVDPSTISMVKIDVEGFECSVLHGGSQLFAGHQPKVMQVETSKPESDACVRELAKKHNYKRYIAKRNSIDSVLVMQ